MEQIVSYLAAFGVGAILSAAFTQILQARWEKAKTLRSERRDLYFKFLEEVMGQQPYQVTGQKVRMICSSPLKNEIDELMAGSNPDGSIDHLLETMRKDLQQFR